MDTIIRSGGGPPDRGGPAQPLLLATGASSASRRSLGTAVFGGMNAATLLAVFFVPVQFFVIETIIERRKRKGSKRPAPAEAPAEELAK